MPRGNGFTAAFDGLRQRMPSFGIEVADQQFGAVGLDDGGAEVQDGTIDCAGVVGRIGGIVFIAAAEGGPDGIDP